jgi:ubiquinone biosynthesis protein
MRHQLVDLFAAITDRDAERVIYIAECMTVSNYRIDRLKLSKEITFLLNKHRDFGPSGTKIGTVGLELLYIFGCNGIDIASDYALLSKAILCVEEAARTLDPNFDIVSVARPFLSKLGRDQWSVQNVKRRFLYPFKTTWHHMQLLPETIQRILQRIEREDLQINFHHTGTEKIEETFNASMNRLTVGVILGSLIIGSSLIITTGVGPLLWGFPTIGILGFLISGILGMYIVVSILRKHH